MNEMVEKTCMNCGISGCDHKDARRCSNGRYLWTPKLSEIEQLRQRVQELTAERDGLMAALEKLTDVFANIGITSGLYDDEQDALKAACDAIASVKEKQNAAN